MHVTRNRLLGAGVFLISVVSGAAPLAAQERETVILDPGWNLVSFCVQETIPLIDWVLDDPDDGIPGLYDEVWTYKSSQGWLGYQPGGIDSLQMILAGVGYWIHINEALPQPVSLTVEGTAFAGPVGLELGWNMVGCLSTISADAEIVLSALGAEPFAVWGLANDADDWRIAAESVPACLSLDQVRPNGGYWVYAPSAASLGPLLSATSPPGMAFGRGPESYYLRIRNVGTGTLSWNAAAGPLDTWLDMCPGEPDESCAEGWSDGETDLVVVGIDWDELTTGGSSSCCGTGDDRGQVCTLDTDCANTCSGGSNPGDPCEGDGDCAGGGTCVIGLCDTSGQWRCGLGSVTVSSNGGSVEIPITASREPISAHYEGYATPVTTDGTAMDLPKVTLAFDLSVDPQTGSATAVLTAEQTPFFPFDVYFNGSSEFEQIMLGTTFSVPPGDMPGMNMFGKELIRSVILRGHREGNDRIVGYYAESIGFPGADSVLVEGAFQLTRTAALEQDPCPESGSDPRRTPRMDADGDGLPDDWEIRYGLDPTVDSTWSDDSDGDGRSNCEEYLDRTDPTVNDAAPATPSISGRIKGLGDEYPDFSGGVDEIFDWTLFQFDFVAADDHGKLRFRGQVGDGSQSDYFIDGIQLAGPGSPTVINGEFDDPVVHTDPNDPWQEVDVNHPYGGWKASVDLNPPDPPELGWDGQPGFFWLNAAAGIECEVWQEITGLTPGETYTASGYYKTGADHQDVGEPSFEARWGGAVPAVVVTVHFGGEVFTAVTDNTSAPEYGEFLFDDLVPGLHMIQIGPHPGFTFTPSEDSKTLDRGPYHLSVNAVRDTSPDIDFVGAPLEGWEPLTVRFVTLRPSAGPMPDPAFVEWYFDGDTGQPPGATGWDPVHTYADPGEYTVTMVYTLPEPDVVVTKTAYVRVGEPQEAPYRLARSVIALHGAGMAEDGTYRLHGIAGVPIADSGGVSESGGLRLQSVYVP